MSATSRRRSADKGNALSEKVFARAAEEGAKAVVVSAKIESEIAVLPADEQTDYLEAVGLAEPGLNRVIRAGYDLLGLVTYFTVGPKEARAWTVTEGTRAPQAAGVIHTDFEKGFIRAETIAYDGLRRAQRRGRRARRRQAPARGQGICGAGRRRAAFSLRPLTVPRRNTCETVAKHGAGRVPAHASRICSMICAFALRLSAGAVFLAGLAASSPAPALVEKVMTVCSGQLCPFFKPAFAVPAGWYEDHKTGMRLGVRLLVPLGESFDTAPAIIYATARHNLEGEDLAGAVAQHQESLRRKIPDVAITRLGDVAGANGSAFQQHEFVSPRLATQPYERVAMATDSDADGNSYVVRLVLTAKSEAVLQSTEETFLALLKGY